MSNIQATLRLELEAAKRKKKKMSTKVFVGATRKNDVLSGRGNGVNRHPGNIQLRYLINEVKESYLMSPKKDKKKFANDVLNKIKAQTPPGRFLRTDDKSSLWYEIPDEGRKGALEKIRQSLREKASELKETLEVKKSESTSEKGVTSTLPPDLQPIRDKGDSSTLVDVVITGVNDTKRARQTLIKAKFDDSFQNEITSRRIDKGGQRKKRKRKSRNRSSGKMYELFIHTLSSGNYISNV
jgi:hypothetical protein